MTFEEFEKATPEDLRRLAKDQFDSYQRPEQLAMDWRLARLQEAQFYLSEIERRESTRVANRDFRMELLVIALIGLELVSAIWSIVIAAREGKDQGAALNKQLVVLETMQTNAVNQGESVRTAMEKQNAILGSLQEASEATADAVKNLAGTSAKTHTATERTASALKDLQATTEAMSKATQGQLELFYNVALNVYWDQPSKQIRIVNNGRTNVDINAAILDGQRLNLASNNVLTPNGSFDIKIPPIDSALIGLPKGSTKDFSLVLYLRNSRQEEFVLDQSIQAFWDVDKPAVGSRTLSIRPEQWSKNTT
jgi:hypothetical protein